MDVEYEQRLVLFLDFLGFKELIKRTTSSPKLIGDITSAIDHIQKLADTGDYMDTVRLTQFSDSVVLSYNVQEASSAFDLINTVGFIVVNLADRGFLVRGGVAVGQLVHTDNYLFGPAFNRAYEIENREAIYPRVVVDSEVLLAAGGAPAAHHSSDEEQGYVKSFLREDHDGRLYVDYVSWDCVVATIGVDDDEYPDYFCRLVSLTREGLRNIDPHVREKYIWLARRCEGMIEMIKALPASDRWRQANPDTYELFVSMNRLATEEPTN